MRLLKLTLVLAVAVLLASPALAQRGGFGGGFGGAGMLLNIKKVQDELKIDKEASDKVQEALKKVREDLKDDLDKARDRNTSQEDRAAIFKKVGEANDKALKGVLSEKQMTRLKQIERQQQGIAMFQSEEVQKTLKLTDDQKGKIKEINDDLGKEIRELFQGGKPGPEAFTKMQAMRKDALSSAMKVLTADQKTEVKTLTGEPFELKPEDFPRGGKPGGKPDKPRTDF
jgi:hypothetical protein